MPRLKKKDKFCLAKSVSDCALEILDLPRTTQN